ncbi:MAG: quinolinate synthase NadA [Spirochaetaceae bacterium]|nr:quinolinate synthase NadA [Spirochaetaceae bacterium]
MATAVAQEAERLFSNLLHVECQPGAQWTLERCHEVAPLICEIGRLKAEKNAIILAHSYVDPEIVYGVADFKSDSYALSLEARDSDADVIVFAGVVFMAETAKILCPHAQVLVPDIASGCSLADSLTGAELTALKARHPEAAVVCYINSSADVKAVSDVCVTSANVYRIIERLPQREILFVPDRLMAANIAREMAARGIDKVIHSSDGTCLVHDQFTAETIAETRARFPGVKVVSHPECTPEVTAASDFVGSTGKMMEYVRDTDAAYFMLLTECGLVSRVEVENPGKQFVGSCRLCPHMKRNSLQKIRDVLVDPLPHQVIELDETVRVAALRSIERMFELT